MLLIADIQERKQEIIDGLKVKRFDNAEEAIEKLLKLDEQRKNAKTRLDKALGESKSVAKQIGQLMQQGKKEEAEEAKSKTADLKNECKALNEELSQVENELRDLLYTIPNYPSALVKEGNSDEDNELISEHGDIPQLPEGSKAHWDLIKEYDIIDFELGNKITGAGFPVYKGQGARLQRALINFFLDEAVKSGYSEVAPPVMVNEASGLGTGQLPDKEGQMYKITDQDLYMIPTAEVPIMNLYRDVIIPEEKLPVKHAGYTPCFRKEAGSWGADVRGLNRLHQFDKVELIEIIKPEESEKAHENMCNHVVGLLKKLELPFRILRLCGGDLGFTAHITYDYEVFSAGQKKWLECSSVSNVLNYQTNRLKCRYKKDKKTVLLHSLNGSGLALPRIMAAIIENNQTAEGIKIPEVLVPYTGFEYITK
ncbi:serine--tRNA ligase [Aureibacter tunicatorum]|uniref:Serine--tRNA ligase n=1 Tax=Aureibacter tunicatorum TaxID=866807 RepID=A0AAE4BQT1_9BACT|nr:serine--tRNA ligase [Aureibacter tunicatorum]MDR6237238.1 seryl-tRNA synthetase [Aureibacter tunicatorum]BDD06230.1 serine--tRNA ligase [Aureibacter tunicatorum]